jgi:hypothetical protein
MRKKEMQKRQQHPFVTQELPTISCVEKEFDYRSATRFDSMYDFG